MNPVFEAKRTAIHFVESWLTPTNCEPHYHQSVEILYAKDCETDVLVNGEASTLAKGELCVADCYDVHSFNSHGNAVCIVIIPPELLNDYLEVRGKMHLSTPFLRDGALCKKIADAMETLAGGGNSALLQKGLIDVIMALIVQGCGLGPYADADLSLMQSVLHFIEDHCAEEIDLNSLSAQFGYSKYYFSRMFNRFFQCNLNEHLAQVRLKRFLSRMQASRDTDMMRTALDCGFNSFQTFYRCFKKHYGVSPKKYLSNL